jgi:hypothetical protein
MISLESLGKEFGTQKVTQGFLPIYEFYLDKLRHKPFNLLEIGVHEGASLKMWSMFFHTATILGVDKHLTEKAKLMDGKFGFNVIEADATKEFTYINNPYGRGSLRWDVVIDDGSHIAKEQIDTFHGLWTSVKPGGYYFVEDLFAIYDTTWNPDYPYSIIDLIQASTKSILIGGNDIQEVHYHGGNSMGGLLVLRKRFEDYRINDEYK